MSRTPYSPFVLNATAPEPWKFGRAVWAAGGGPSTTGASDRAARRRTANRKAFVPPTDTDRGTVDRDATAGCFPDLLAGARGGHYAGFTIHSLRGRRGSPWRRPVGRLVRSRPGDLAGPRLRRRRTRPTAPPGAGRHPGPTRGGLRTAGQDGLRPDP